MECFTLFGIDSDAKVKQNVLYERFGEVKLLYPICSFTKQWSHFFFSQSEFTIVNKVQVIQFASRATSQANKSLPHAFADICATWVNNTIKKNNTL